MATACRSARPAAEALESRRLTAADVALVSATTDDSRSVLVRYEVGAPSRNGLDLKVSRSSDANPSADDLSIAAIDIAADSVDEAGRPALAPGEHRLRIAVDLPPNPARPYVVVSSEGSDRSAAFRTYTLGVIAHGGFQPGGWKKYGPPWERTMERSLKAEGYDAVIPFNWVGKSDSPGAVVKEAPRLAGTIRTIAKRFPADAVVNLHMIGHSEGAVMQGQALKALDRREPESLRRGYVEFTLLDPYSANNDVPTRQGSMSNGFLGWIARRFSDLYQSKASDPPVIVPPNVDDAQVFFQHTPVMESHAAYEGIANLWGQAPRRGGAKLFDVTAGGVSHSGRFAIYDWYQRVVVPTLGDGLAFTDHLALTAQAVGARIARETTEANDASPEFHDTGPAGSTVRIVARSTDGKTGKEIGLTIVGADRRWSITARPMQPGSYVLTAVADEQVQPGVGPALPIRPTVRLGGIAVAPALHDR